VIAGDPGHAGVRGMLQLVRRTFLPQRVVASARTDADAGLLPLIDGKDPGPGGARAYVCRNYACRAPVESLEDLGKALIAG